MIVDSADSGHGLGKVLIFKFSHFLLAITSVGEHEHRATVANTAIALGVTSEAFVLRSRRSTREVEGITQWLLQEIRCRRRRRYSCFLTRLEEETVRYFTREIFLTVHRHCS